MNTPPACRPRSRRRTHSRGIALVWMVMALSGMVLMSAFAIDMGWLYQRRENLQATVDAAALAGDWALSQGDTDAAANTVATSVLTANGYTTGTGPAITLTPHSNSTANNYSVSISSPEPMFFGYTVSQTGKTNVAASATANFVSEFGIGYAPGTYGEASNPFVLCSYGPDQGATRGDAVNTRWTDVTGEYAKTPNPLNYNSLTGLPVDAGETYIIQPVTNYASLNTVVGDSLMSVQIFDPQTSVSSSDPDPVDQYVNAAGSTLSSSETPNEAWTYTLSAENTATDVTTQIASATYGETQTNLEGMWVTPPGFTINLSGYNLAQTVFLVNVKTANPYVAGQVNALDKNGYQLRAGPDFDNSSNSNDKSFLSAFTTDSNGDQIVSPTKSSAFNDTIWNSDSETNAGTASAAPLAPLTSQGSLCITAHASGSGEIYFGSLGKNPNSSQATIITFNGFDEDTGATGITYNVTEANQSYSNTTFTGVLGWQAQDNNGNGIWSPAGVQTRGVSNPTNPSNTVYFAPGAYQGGTWTADYETGSEDVTTWNWTVNYAGGSNYTKPKLIYTTYNDW
jgi:Flp pilus assembly protein TadG